MGGWAQPTGLTSGANGLMQVEKMSPCASDMYFRVFWELMATDQTLRFLHPFWQTKASLNTRVMGAGGREREIDLSCQK